MNSKAKFVMKIAGVAVLAGLILCLIGFVTGGMQTLTFGKDGIRVGNEQNIVKVNKTYSSIKNVDVDIDVISLNFKKGDEFKVYGSYNSNNTNLVISESGGILSIKEKGKILDDIGFFNIFGISNLKKEELTIELTEEELDSITVKNDISDTYISDINAKKLTIKNDSGTVDARNLTIGDLKINSDIGGCKLNSVKCGSSDITMSTGDLNAENFYSKKFIGKFDIGDININGTLLGKTDITSDTGDINLNINGKEQDYKCYADTDIGSISLNGDSFGSKLVKNDGANAFNSLNVYSNIGAIEINFAK